jgi:uncharacterized membrane protein YeiH
MFATVARPADTFGLLTPAGFRDWRYLVATSIAGLLCFAATPSVERSRRAIETLDATGLGVFSVAGASKALQFGVGPVQAVLLGAITGIGGGIVRDVLLGEVPSVFRRELYAVPALLAATIWVSATRLTDPGAGVAVPAVGICVLARLIGLRFGIGVPAARPSQRSSARDAEPCPPVAHG